MTTKEKVLNLLSQNENNSVSGEKLAQVCDVSRAAIWKAVTSLRQQGYPIEGTTNGGYILQPNADVFTQETFTAALSKAYPSLSASHSECFKEIDSTNTYAKRLLSECGNLRDYSGKLTEAGQKYHKSIYVAESQTAGRGRLGRTFYSPEKTGIYLTVVYAPEGGITQPALLTAVSAVAMCRVLKRLYKINPQIKWINDIFVNGKKISGILTEGFTNFETGTIESAIIGIGTNISDNPDVFPPEVSAIAGSIQGAGATDEKVTRCQLAAAIAGEVLTILEEPADKVMEEYKTQSFIVGKTVQVHPVIGDEKSVYTATAIDIDNNAGLVVKLEDGTVKTLNSGEVSLHSETLLSSN